MSKRRHVLPASVEVHDGIPDSLAHVKVSTGHRVYAQRGGRHDPRPNRERSRRATLKVAVSRSAADL